MCGFSRVPCQAAVVTAQGCNWLAKDGGKILTRPGDWSVNFHDVHMESPQDYRTDR